MMCIYTIWIGTQLRSHEITVVGKMFLAPHLGMHVCSPTSIQSLVNYVYT